MADWIYYIALVVPHADQSHFLLLPDGETWTLPRFTLHALFNNLYILPRAIHAQLDADMIVLRTLAQQVDEDSHVMHAVLLMENRTHDWNPPLGAEWVESTGLAKLTLSDEWIRPMLETVIDRLADPPPSERPLWFQPGWFAQAEVWITDVLIGLGYTLLRPPEQFKHGTISSVLRVETTNGNIYFKVALNLPLFGNEPKLSAALGQLFPDYIPAPLVIDEARRWMLTADFGTELRTTRSEVSGLKTIVQTFAHLQIETTNHIETLFSAGCLDRRLDVLERQIDDLLAAEACCAQLNAEELVSWQSCGPQLKMLCKELTRYNLPYTLVHGDFHAGNIAIHGEKVLFFDWTDACIAHPFFDLPVLLEFDAAQDHIEILRDVYLAEWTAYEPLKRLHEAYTIASILGALHQAVSYKGIFYGVEIDQRANWAFGVPTFARRILQQIKSFPAS